MFPSISPLQSFGIGYLRVHPDGQVRVHADEPKPIIRVKPSSTSGFRRYGFVDAVLGLDPLGKLGMLQSDFKACFIFLLLLHLFFPDVCALMFNSMVPFS